MSNGIKEKLTKKENKFLVEYSPNDLDTSINSKLSKNKDGGE